MPVEFAKRPYYCQSEARLGVSFARASVRPDGTPGDPQYWSHADGGWDNAYDPAKHVRPMDRPFPDRPNYQSFALPAGVADDDSTVALTCVLKSDGTVGQEGAPIDWTELTTRRGFIYF